MSLFGRKNKTGSVSRLLVLPTELRLMILKYVLQERFVFYMASGHTDELFTKYYILWNTGIKIVNRQLYGECLSLTKNVRNCKPGFLEWMAVSKLRELNTYDSLINLGCHPPILSGLLHATLTRYIPQLQLNSLKRPGTISPDTGILSQSRALSKTKRRYLVGEIEIHATNDDLGHVRLYGLSAGRCSPICSGGSEKSRHMPMLSICEWERSLVFKMNSYANTEEFWR